MWVLKIKTSAKNQFLGSLAEKHGVSLTGYPLSYYRKGKNLELIASGFMFGEEKNKKAFLRELKKRKELVEWEFEKGFFVIVVKQSLLYRVVYDPRIIWLSPVIINKSGYHIWDIASFDRDLLSKIIKISEKYLGGEVLKFKQEKIKNIQFTKLVSELSAKQKEAMELAINSGYYEYPKKINMESLAKKMGVSYSTYQFHLKKAESKLMPDVFRGL